MALFEITEFASLVQRDVDTATVTLLRSLCADEFAAEVGAGVVTDPPQAGIKSLALRVCTRPYMNPAGAKAQTAGPLSVSYDDAKAGLYLTDEDRNDLRRALGLKPRGKSAAKSVTMAMNPDWLGFTRPGFGEAPL